MAQSAEMLTKFMKRSAARRNKKPSRIQASYTSPLPAKGRSDVNTPLYRARSGEPPPGVFEGSTQAGIAKKISKWQAAHDVVTNRQGQHNNFGPPREQAPYKKGQVARSRQLRRRTLPNPGSVYNRQRPKPS